LTEPGSAYRLSVLEERWRTDRSPRVFLQLADELRRAGRADRALQVLRDGLAGRPESVSGWVALGRMLLEAGEPRTAIEAFEQALERDAGQLVATKLLTEAWIVVGDAERATTSLERARLLSLPDADREQLAEQIAALRGPADAPPSVDAGRSAAPPFDLPPPAALPVLDLSRVGPGQHSWRRGTIEAEPFAALLAPPPGLARLDVELRAAGIFGLAAPAAPAEPAREALARTGLAVAEAEPAAPASEATAEPPSDPLAEPESAPAPPALPSAPEIFRPHSIGEEVEREALAELEPGPAVAAAPAATTTLATLYLAQGHLDEAESELRSVLAVRPDDAEALAGIAEVERRRAAAAPAAPRLGLTARRLERLRGVYDALRVARRAREARVS